MTLKVKTQKILLQAKKVTKHQVNTNHRLQGLKSSIIKLGINKQIGGSAVCIMFFFDVKICFFVMKTTRSTCVPIKTIFKIHMH